MRINRLSFRNITCYGNETQIIEFDEDKSSFYLVTGSNGQGKCLHPDTKLNIQVKDKVLEQKFKDFLASRRLP